MQQHLCILNDGLFLVRKPEYDLTQTTENMIEYEKGYQQERLVI